MKKIVVLLGCLCGLLVWFLEGCSGSSISPAGGKFRSQDIPLNVVASDTLKNGRIKISWDSVSGATGYLVYRSTGPLDSFVLLSAEVSGQGYLDSSVIPDTAYFYRIRAIVGNGDTSMPSNSDMGMALLDAASYFPSFSASDGLFPDKVLLSWRKPFLGIKVAASKTDSAGLLWTALFTTFTDSIYIDSIESPGPHLYRLTVLRDSLANPEYFFDKGYRMVSDREFFIEVNATVKHSQAKLTKLGSLGSEQVQGDTTGTLTYNANMNGLSSVNISIDYVDYRDYYLTLSGRQYTVITNVFSQAGTVTDTVHVTGIYPGALVYDITVSSGKPTGGTYTVIQQDRPPSVIQFADVAQYVQ